MQGKTHIAAAAALSLGIITYKWGNQDLLESGILIASTVSGSLLPDIDIKQSKVSHKHKFISFFIRLFIEHRGTHSIIFMGMLTIPLFIIVTILPEMIKPYGYIYGIGILLGYASHILLDMLTPKGSPILNPICKYSVSILPIQTGGFIEFIFRMGLYVFSIYLFWENIKPIVDSIVNKITYYL